MAARCLVPVMTAGLRHKVLREPVMLLAFGFGTGLSPKAPGTAGSLVALPLAFLTASQSLQVQLAIGVALFLAGLWICGEAARRVGVHDHPGIVWDEIVAMYLLLATVPVSAPLWLAAFLLFRLFDIWKPWPIRDLDHRLGGGLGIMLDDLLAAFYAAPILGLGWWLMS